MLLLGVPLLEIAIVGGVMLVTAFFVNFVSRTLFPRIHREYAAGGLHRRFDDSRMLYIFLHPFVTAFILLFLVQRLQPLHLTVNEIAYVYWAISALPGIFLNYTSFNMSFLLACSWWLTSGAQLATGAHMITLRQL